MQPVVEHDAPRRIFVFAIGRGLMRRGASPAVVLATLAGWSAPAAAALPTHFEHVVVIVQENRTPDNLFQGLCTQANACSITPTAKQYDIQTGNWLDKTAPGGVIQPTAVELAARYQRDGADDSCG